MRSSNEWRHVRFWPLADMHEVSQDVHKRIDVGLCGEEKSLRVRAHHGPIPMDITDWPIGSGSVNGRAFVDRGAIHIHGLQAASHEFPDGSKAALRLGYRTALAVPLLRRGEAIGTLSIRRTE